MGVTAIVEGGQIVQTASQTSLESSKTNQSGTNKEDFLQLLVAQMKYQDPMEPTSNTEWVSQYATFSELEEMQNMAGTLELSRASSLVGQTVIMETKDSNGNAITVQGNVDYVSYESGKPYLSINGELYSMDDLSLVVDDNYLDACKIASQFMELYDKLPKLDNLTVDDKDSVYALKEIYENMSSYQQSFLDQSYLSGIQAYIEKMDELTAGSATTEEETNIDAIL